MSIYDELTKASENLKSAKKAILGRGGEISQTAGLKDLPDAIFNIPADASLAFHTDEEVAYSKSVPSGAAEYAMLSKVGGRTRKCKNFAVSTEDSTSTARGITVTRNVGKSSAVLNGTATADTAIRLFGNFKLPIGTYTASVIGLNSSDRLYVGRINSDSVIINYIQTNSPKTFTLTEKTECFVQVVFAVGSTYNNTEIKVQIEKGDTATDYEPYFEGLRSAPVTETKSFGVDGNVIDTRSVPEMVQALDGYGQGNPDDMTEYNYIDFDRKEFVKRGVIVGGAWVSDETVTDISDILTDKFIKVEGGGSLEFVNEHEYAVPSTVKYTLKVGT